MGRLRALLRGRSGRPDAIKAKGITPDIIQEAAAATEGFSGRELAKLVASMQASPTPAPAEACQRHSAEQKGHLEARVCMPVPPTFC